MYDEEIAALQSELAKIAWSQRQGTLYYNEAAQKMEEAAATFIRNVQRKCEIQRQVFHNM